MQYFHVDVFSVQPMQGNGLTVVFPKGSVTDAVMLDITREFKQFETIFITKDEKKDEFSARIFTVDEELQFAGHPILGAAAVIHRKFFPAQATAAISLNLPGRLVFVKSIAADLSYQAVMNQGTPDFIARVENSHYARIAQALNLSAEDIDDTLPLEAVSTGLPYLLVPLKSGLQNAKITIPDFEAFLAGFGAKFVYVFNSATLECRTWDNQGLVEDSATGSAAGPLCAYLVKNGLKNIGEMIQLHQGAYVNRSSILEGWVENTSGQQSVFIRGDVAFFAEGSLTI